MTISRTETHAAANFGSLEAAKSTGVKMKRVWISAADERTRENHTSADSASHGKPVGMEAEFPVVHLLFPGDQAGDPAETINCFVGDTVIHSTPNILKVYRRNYQGEMIRLKTKAGQVITGTPNHPILTAKGWIGLGELSEGDDVLCDSRSVERDTILLPDMNVQNPPATIEQIFSSSLESGNVFRTSGGIVDFHGDGMESDVDIVLTSGLLKYRVSKQIADFPLAISNILKRSLLGNCSPSKLVRRSLHTSNCIMGGSSLLLSLRRRHGSPLQRLGFALRSALDFILRKDSRDDVSRNTVVAGDQVLGLSKVDVSVDYVLSVESFNFSGHVYNLQTVDDWYSVKSIDNTQGIISHNCRCAVGYVSAK
jgi:hypothetical protein